MSLGVSGPSPRDAVLLRPGVGGCGFTRCSSQSLWWCLSVCQRELQLLGRVQGPGSLGELCWVRP